MLFRSKDKAAKILTQNGRQRFKVFDIDCRHLVQEIDERNLVPHGELPGRYGHEHADDRSIDRVLGEVVADGKKFRIFRIDQVEIEIVP